MYEIFDTTTRKVIALADEPVYVYRSPRNGVWIRCEEKDAECVAVEGTRYSIRGRTQVEDAPTTVAVRKADAAARIRKLTAEALEHAETIEDFKAYYTDLAEAIIDLIDWRYANENANEVLSSET